MGKKTAHSLTTLISSVLATAVVMASRITICTMSTALKCVLMNALTMITASDLNGKKMRRNAKFTSVLLHRTLKMRTVLSAGQKFKSSKVTEATVEANQPQAQAQAVVVATLTTTTAVSRL